MCSGLVHGWAGLGMQVVLASGHGPTLVCMGQMRRGLMLQLLEAKFDRTKVEIPRPPGVPRPRYGSGYTQLVKESVAVPDPGTGL